MRYGEGQRESQRGKLPPIGWLGGNRVVLQG